MKTQVYSLQKKYVSAPQNMIILSKLAKLDVTVMLYVNLMDECDKVI
jgi:hypothetical protein